MKAIDISGQAPGGKRTPLSQVLPLKAPYVVQVFPFYGCNFKCAYCIFSVDKEQRHFISDKVMMDFGLFKKAIDDMTAFPDKVKVLRFVGIGEPLLHKQIAKMVEYAVSKNVAETVEILTNASALTPGVTDQLIAAGLSRMVVSIQGTSAQRYREVCGAEIDFETFIQNLKYFYQHKMNARMYIKIIDSAVKDESEKQDFYKIFGDICDTIAVEHTVPIHTGVNFEYFLESDGYDKTQFGLPVKAVKICPQPFFTMQFNPDGKVVPCYSFEYPLIAGNVETQSMVDIWNGTSLQHFRRKMLDGIEGFSEVCQRCSMIKYRFFPEDDLAQDAKRLKKYYE